MDRQNEKTRHPKYVTIGDHEHTGIHTTMSYNKFWWTFTIVVIIILIGIAIFIAMGVRYHRDATRIKYRRIKRGNMGQMGDVVFGIHSNPGRTARKQFIDGSNGKGFKDAATCERVDTREWGQGRGQTNTGQCFCKPPFWGTTCQRESFRNSYYAIGRTDGEDATLNVSNTIQTDRLSLPFNESDATCTNACDDDPDCVGVLWELEPSDNMEGPGTCSLLSSLPEVNTGEIIDFDPAVDSNLFLKNGNRPVFHGKVFVYRGSLPTRFWLNQRRAGSLFTDISNMGRTGRNGGVLRMHEDTLYHLNFYPNDVINDDNLVMVFNTSTFKRTEALDIIAMGGDNPIGNWYVFRPNTDQEFILPRIYVTTGQSPTYYDNPTQAWGMVISGTGN